MMINFAADFELFKKENLGSVRTLVDETGGIWFVAKDVCDVLEINNNRQALTRLDEDEKATINPHNFSVISNDGENRMGSELNIINESGMYSLVLTSRKPQAKEFKNWLTREVIPSIRQHGGYIYGQEKLQENEKAELKKEMKTIVQKVKKLQARRHELIADVKTLKDQKRHLKQELKSVNEYADMFEDMFERAQLDYQKAFDEIETLKNRIKRMEHPELFKEPEKGPKMFVGRDGLIYTEKMMNVLKEENEMEDERDL